MNTTERPADRAGNPPAAKRAALWPTARAVLWSFFGVRQRAGYESDVQRLDPRHVVLAGIVGALLFVLALVVLVKWVVGSGIAAG